MRGWRMGMAAAVGIVAAGVAEAQDGRAELAPNGTVRVALVEAPNGGVFFVGRGRDGALKGVTRDLAQDLARRLGVKAEFKVYPNSGEATEATRTGAVEMAFMPVDASRREAVAFGPAYYDLESTYLVTAASGVTDVKEVDRPGMRVIGIANTTTIRASARTLTTTQPVAVASVAESVAMMRDGRADAFALSRDSLPPFAADIPGSRIVTGGFQQTQVAVAVPKGRPAALAAVTAWLTGAKRDGTVGRIFAAHGLGGEKAAE